MTKSTTLCLALAVCGAAAVPAQDPWPGGPEATRVDITWLDSELQDEMSGAVWNPETEKLWIVNTDYFWRLSCPGHCDLEAVWRIDESGPNRAEWPLSGDNEAITQADWGEETVFIGVERTGAPARPAIREYDVSGPLGTSTEINWWKLDEMGGDFDGLEALTFVPDAWLTAAAFVDRTNTPYTESDYGTGGLFFAGKQANGHVFVFDLDRTVPAAGPGNYTFVGEYRTVGVSLTPETEIAGLEFDRSNGVLYSYHNYESVPASDVLNELALTPVNVAPPGDPPVLVLQSQRGWLGPRVDNNEGIALVPSVDCDEFGYRRFFLMTDDGGQGDSVGIYPLFHCDPRPAPAVEGCISFLGAPLAGRPVRLEQAAEPSQQTTTDADGCYAFETAVSGKRFLVGLRGSVVP